MYILREWLGGAEFINMDTKKGKRHWEEVHQDSEAAENILEGINLNAPFEYIINANEPEYIERYSISIPADTLRYAKKYHINVIG